MPGGTSVSRIQSSGASAGGRVFSLTVTVRARLGENHSHTPGGGAAASTGSPISGPLSPDVSRSVFRARFSSCLAPLGDRPWARRSNP